MKTTSTIAKKIANHWRRLPRVGISWTAKAVHFVMNGAGKEYGITRRQKIGLLYKITRNYLKIQGGVRWEQHVLMVEEILRTPKSIRGDVVECGCWNGQSTASLSSACKLTNRKLFVCDSFEGLPEPAPGERYGLDSHWDERFKDREPPTYYVWHQGEFASEGGLQTVIDNVTRYGRIDCCEFVKGYYNESLKNLKTNAIVMVFEDADIVSSVKACLLHLWPKLQYGGKFFCHEPWSIDVVRLFYEQEWWQTHLNAPAPGFYGSGHGILLGIDYTGIGYSRKVDFEKLKLVGKRLTHAGSYVE